MVNSPDISKPDNKSYIFEVYVMYFSFRNIKLLGCEYDKKLKLGRKLSESNKEITGMEDQI